MTRTDSSDLRVALFDASGRGGVAQYTFFLADALADAGARVTLLSGHDYEMRAMPCRFHFVPLFRPSRIAAALAWLGRIGTRKAARRRSGGTADADAAESSGSRIRRGKLDRLRQLRLRLLLLEAVARLLATRTRIVHVQWGGDLKDEIWFLRLLKRLGIRTLHTAHDLLPHEGAAPDEAELHASLYRTADHVVVLAEGPRSELIQEFGLAPERVTAIPHGGDEVFSSIEQAEARRSIGIEPAAKVILFFGTIKPYKGLEYLLQAFDSIREGVEGAMLLVAGGAVPSDPGEARYYADLVRTLRSHPDVVIVPGYVPVERIGMYFAASDVVVLPYVLTYHSGVLLTAYAMGKPVIVSDTGGLGEAVEEGRTGFVVPPRDVGALAARIETILRLPDRGAAMGRRARELSEELYSWRAVAQRHAALYRRLLGRGGAQPRRAPAPSVASEGARPEAPGS